MDKYGEFTDSVNSLDSSLVQVRSVWVDQTAVSYDGINENMKAYVSQITGYLENSVKAHNLVKNNYRESEIDDELNQLSAKVAAV